VLLVLIAAVALLLLLRGSTQPGTHVVHPGQPAFQTCATRSRSSA